VRGRRAASPTIGDLNGVIATQARRIRSLKLELRRLREQSGLPTGPARARGRAEVGVSSPHHGGEREMDVGVVTRGYAEGGEQGLGKGDQKGWAEAAARGQPDSGSGDTVSAEDGATAPGAFEGATILSLTSQQRSGQFNSRAWEHTNTSFMRAEAADGGTRGRGSAAGVGGRGRGSAAGVGGREADDARVVVEAAVFTAARPIINNSSALPAFPTALRPLAAPFVPGQLTDDKLSSSKTGGGGASPAPAQKAVERGGQHFAATQANGVVLENLGASALPSWAARCQRGRWRWMRVVVFGAPDAMRWDAPLPPPWSHFLRIEVLKRVSTGARRLVIVTFPSYACACAAVAAGMQVTRKGRACAVRCEMASSHRTAVPAGCALEVILPQEAPLAGDDENSESGSSSADDGYATGEEGGAESADEAGMDFREGPEVGVGGAPAGRGTGSTEEVVIDIVGGAGVGDGGGPGGSWREFTRFW
jgi:hypothetical protein